MWIVFSLCFYFAEYSRYSISFLIFVYNICSKFLKAPFYPKVSLPPLQGDVLGIDRQPDVSTCLPSLSDWVLINFPYVWGFSAHTCNIRSRGRLAPSLIRGISTEPTHRAQSLPALIDDKHTYFCNLSGTPDPCLVLKRKFSFVQRKLCSTPATTPICPSPSAFPMGWFPVSVNTSSFGKVSAPCTSSLLLSQRSSAARFLQVPATRLAMPVHSSYTGGFFLAFCDDYCCPRSVTVYSSHGPLSNQLETYFS